MEHLLCDKLRIDSKILEAERKFLFTVNNNNSDLDVKTSPALFVGSQSLTMFQVQIICYKITHLDCDEQYINLIFVRFYKSQPNANDLVYILNFTCNEYNICNKPFTSDDGTWHLIHKNTMPKYSFDVILDVDMAPPVNSFASLHEDDDLTDFELRSEDGAVRVHRAVLAAASPVLRRMLCGTWRETTEGHVEVPGTSKSNLQDLKDFIYLHTMPEAGLEQLVMLASYYMMPDLEQKCVDKLVRNLSASNAYDMLEFAVKNKVSRLILAIMESLQKGKVKVTDIRKHNSNKLKINNEQ